MRLLPHGEHSTWQKARKSAFFYLQLGYKASGPRRRAAIIKILMVRDGYFYAAPLIVAGLLLGWLTRPAWTILPFLLAAFLLWFFRNPERAIPQEPGAIVSPADGKVTEIAPVTIGNERRTRISIFLSVFNVHVNRAPIEGVVRDVRYQRGKYLNAMNAASAEQNEQNIVTVEGDGQTVVFKQIAGLLARRIVFHPKVGDRLERGQRVGLIKFGSRVDVLMDVSARLQVKVGDHVKGGESVLAYVEAHPELAGKIPTSGNVGQKWRTQLSGVEGAR
jgi:phosphatidylserine decarboxylase